MDLQRQRYVYGIITAPSDPWSYFEDNEEETKKVFPRVSLDRDWSSKSLEERAKEYLQGVKHDIVTMREFFGRGQDISELFCHHDVDARGKKWLLNKLQDEFAEPDIRAFFLYYTGHGHINDGAWCLHDGTLAPDELFKLWQESPSGKSGDSVLIIISDSCFSGHWVEAAKAAQLSTVSVQSSTDHKSLSLDHHDIGGLFTYNVYNRGSGAFQSIFSFKGFFAAFRFALWLVYKEAVALVCPRSKQLYPQIYVPDEFRKIMARRGGTIQPYKVINNGRFLFVDTFEWIMFR